MKFFAKFKRRTFKYFPVLKYLFAISLLIAFMVFVSFQLPAAINYLRLTSKVILPNNEPLKSDNGRINILFLGAGGALHDGPNLTDTIIVASLPASGSGLPYLISVPRDIYLDSLQGKINSAYALGEEKKQGVGGLILSKAAVSQLIGLPLHYAIKIDFEVFSKIIDLMEGVDVVVENTFDDYKYPIVGKESDLCQNDINYSCRYEHLHFEKGLIHMDGNLALKFARSRQSTGDEGTDFSRIKRQQQIIVALKDKFLTVQNLFDQKKITNVYNTLKGHIDTDIPESNFGSFFKLALHLKKSPVKNVILGADFFFNPPIDERGWILLPKNNDPLILQNYIKANIY